MQPIKDKNLHYFILEDNSEGFFGTINELHEKKSILDGLKRDQLHGILDFFKPQSIYPYLEDGTLRQGSISSQHFKAPFKVKYIEEVISLRGYQNSVEFTIGSSKRKKESKKYLVGIEINLDSLEHQFKRIQKNCPWYNIGFDDFSKIDSIEGYGGYMNWVAKEKYSFPFPAIRIDSKILEHAGNTVGVKDYSYDDLFKYYTLLCS